MAYEVDGLIHVYDDERDEYITENQCMKILTERQMKRLFEDGWVIVEGVTYEL